MPSKPDIWMPLYIGDYLAATAHLDAEESGAYLHLLMHSWKNGSLPADTESLRRIAKVPKDAWSNAWRVLNPFFDFAEDGTPTQGRLERIREEWSSKQLKSKDKARKAAETRWSKSYAPSMNSDAPSNPQAMLDSCPSPTSSPISKEQKQKTPRAKKPRAGLYEPVKDLIFRYYRAKNEVDPEWNGREGKALAMLLAANPTAPIEHWTRCLTNRFRSEVTHGERPGGWIGKLSSFTVPLNQFGKPINGGINGTQQNSNNRPSPAQQRRESSNASIDAAFDALRAMQPARDDETNPGPQAESGHPGGHGSDVRAGVGAHGAEVRDTDFSGVTLEGIT